MRARRTRRPTFVAMLGAVLALPVSASHAQEAAPAVDSSEYTRTIEGAVERFKARDFSRARELFQVAHNLDPSARTLRGVGLSDFESGRYAVAIAELEASLVEPRKPLDAQQRSEIQAVIAHARGFVGVLEVQVTPADARLTVDGIPVSGQSFQLDAGLHVLRASAAGYVENEQQLRVLPADITKAQLDLAALRPLADPAANGSDSTQRTAGWIVGGIGAAGVVVGSVFGVRSIIKHNESDRYCGKDGCRDRRGVTAMESARSAGDISTVAFVAGALALGAGTVLLLTAPSAETERAPSATRLQIGPGAVRLSGVF